MRHGNRFRGTLLALWLACVCVAGAQDGPPFPPPPGDGFGPGGPPGFGGPPPGGPMSEVIPVLKKFDADHSGWLNATERAEARAFLAKEASEGRGRRGPGGRGGGPRGPGGPGAPSGTPVAGEKISPADVPSAGAAGLYDPAVVRTLFLEFESADWEQELADFKNTDVDIPATVRVDGKVLRDVGVHFRGASSFHMVGAGWKRSLNLSLDDRVQGQNLGGYRSLNLLNAHEDPTFLRSFLYLEVARHYLPAAKSGFVRVVINGENWGVYENVQQLNKDFIREWFGTTEGARWKVPGSPQAKGSLAYLGDDASAYKKLYEIKSKDDPKSWSNLVTLCRTLSQTNASVLEQSLPSVLDVDQALRFLAVENALVNNDGYWIRTSDYFLYQDLQGRFHVLPQDINETFTRPGGPGFGGGPGGPGGRRGPRPGGPPPEGFAGGPPPGGPFGGPPGGPPAGGPPGGGRMGGPGARFDGVKLDPLWAAEDPSKPLISRLLSVPAWRAKYLGYVRDIAERWLDWKQIGPMAEQAHQTLTPYVKADTRKLDSTEHFLKNLVGDVQGEGGFGGRATIGLKAFCDQRREYLLNLPTLRAAR